MIVTERLELRPFRAEDLPAFVACRSVPEVARYQSWDTPFSMADAERFLASQQAVEFGAPGEWVQLAAVDGRTVSCAATARYGSTGGWRSWASRSRRRIRGAGWRARL